MEEDIDIYEDLPSFVVKLDETSSKASEEENAELKKQVAELTDKLEQLRKLNTTLEVNLSSLLKTAKAEIARKDRTINDLRKELDDALFKRGKYVHRSQGPNSTQPQNNAQTFKHEQNTRSYSTEYPSGYTDHSVNNQTENSYRSDRKSVDAELSEDEDRPEENRRNVERAVSTVFGERLRKRLADAEATEKRERLLKCNSTDNTSSGPGNATSVVETEKEIDNKHLLWNIKSQSTTSRDSSTEFVNASTKRTDFERSENFRFDGKRVNEESYETGSVKRIKVERDDEDVSSKEENRDGFSTRSQQHLESQRHSHRSTSREKQNPRRFNGERDKYRFHSNKEMRENRSNYYDKRDYTKRGKSMEKSRFNHDESESDRLYSDRSKDGYWHDHDYTDHHRNRHRDRDYFRDESSSERTSRRTRNVVPFSSESRYRKDRFDRNSFNHNEIAYNPYSKHEQDTLKNASKSLSSRTPYKTRSNSHLYERHERGSSREHSSTRERKKRESDEYGSRKIKVEKSPYNRRSESLEIANEDSKDFNRNAERNFPIEIEKYESVNDKMNPVKDEPCLVDQSNLSIEEGEIPDVPIINPVKKDVDEENEECKTNVGLDADVISSTCNENRSQADSKNKDSAFEQVVKLQNPIDKEEEDCSKSETVKKCEIHPTSTVSDSTSKTTLDSETIPAELNGKDCTEGSNDTCEPSREKTIRPERLNGTCKPEEKHVKEVPVKKETVDMTDKKPTTIEPSNDKQSAENNGNTNVVRLEDSEKIKDTGDKPNGRILQTNSSNRATYKCTRTRKPSQNNKASVNVEGKVIVVVRRKNPVRLADNNANMTVLVNSQGANSVPTATNNITKPETELKSRASRRTVDRSISNVSVPPGS